MSKDIPQGGPAQWGWIRVRIDTKKYQSGKTDVTGGITRVGDEMVRTALYEAANILLSRVTRFSVLKRWGMDIAKRRGTKRAKVALAHKIGVILIGCGSTEQASVGRRSLSGSSSSSARVEGEIK